MQRRGQRRGLDATCHRKEKVKSNLFKVSPSICNAKFSSWGFPARERRHWRAPLLHCLTQWSRRGARQSLPRPRIQPRRSGRHARRMGRMCDRVVEAGGTVIADFICPTAEPRAAFGEAFVIWIDRIEAGRFEDTNRMFDGAVYRALSTVSSRPSAPDRRRFAAGRTGLHRGAGHSRDR